MGDLVVVAVICGVVGGIVGWAIARRTKTVPPHVVASQPRQYWVGVSTHEGTDRAAADAAFASLQNSYSEGQQVLGDVELCDQSGVLKRFKVV